MLVFKSQNLNHPMALAIKAYGRYLDLPVDLLPEGAEPQLGEVLIHMMEATRADFHAMRRLETLVGEKLRFVMLISPPPAPGPLAEALQDMPHVYRIDPNSSAEPFVQHLKTFVDSVDKKKEFFLDFNKAESEMDAGRATEAISIVRRLQSTAVDAFACNLLLAKILYAGDKLEDALTQAKLAVKGKPRSLAAMALLSAIYQKLGRAAEAEKVMESSLSVAEASISYLVQLGDVYFDQGKVAASKAAYKKAKELAPGNRKADEGLLAVSLLEGDFKAAKESSVAKSLNFDLARFCNSRAVALTANRRFDCAETMYLNTINLLGRSPDVYKVQFNLGLCLKKSGDLKKSLSYFEACKTTAPATFLRLDEQIAAIRDKIKT
jgi:tetratricopeptide (TPR) repeat protein